MKVATTFIIFEYAKLKVGAMILEILVPNKK
jgi:hypothetical protein